MQNTQYTESFRSIRCRMVARDRRFALFVTTCRVPLQTLHVGRQVERFTGAAPSRCINGPFSDSSRRYLSATQHPLVGRSRCDSRTSHPIQAHPEDIKLVPDFEWEGCPARLFTTPRSTVVHDGLVARWYPHLARKTFSSLHSQRSRRGTTSADQG